MTPLRVYRIALAASLMLNLLLGASIWLYIHYAGLLDIVETAVGFVD